MEFADVALNIEQQEFAAKNHGLVYAFLNANKLPENDFYDVIIFGYLQAVKNYFEKPVLARKYSFATIAWNTMKSRLSNHYLKQSRLKRKSVVIDLESIIHDGNGETLPFQEALSAPDSYIIDFETELLMIELASKVSKQEMEIIRMKIDGYGIKEIAKAKKMTMKSVQNLLASLYETVLAVCYK